MSMRPLVWQTMVVQKWKTVQTENAQEFKVVEGATKKSDFGAEGQACKNV